ncbi:Endonuclease V-like protein [Quillaja saponaria]|uniref:Endonuclease V-like protein n=1 Tax=Quillaja saponaria TaxID=32244 RepID=A0AAD7LIC7_QUISA|nr:Endonuclease V-like protein [Quillaja saponaria]
METSPPSQVDQNWLLAQEFLKKKLITEDSFIWKLPAPTSICRATDVQEEEEEEGMKVLRYIGGVDISFSKEDPLMACGTLVVLDLHTLQIVYEDFSLVTLDVPYVPGFLAFREAPVLLELLEKMKRNTIHFYPQLLMVDGNGILHPRGFGLACHLGVMADIPTIGIGKNLHHVDGLNQSSVRQLLEAKENNFKDFIALTGCSGKIWGAAIRSTQGSLKPIFVSVGHRISLNTAITIVKMICKYRVPEPIRQADIRSREYLRKLQMNVGTVLLQ